jgi:hypothetical protein
MFSYCIVFTADHLPVYVTASTYNLGPHWIAFLNVAGEAIFRVLASKVLYIERSDIAS